MLRETRKRLARFFGMAVADGSEKGVPFMEWCAPVNQHRPVTRGELLSVLKNLKSLNLTDDSPDLRVVE